MEFLREHSRVLHSARPYIPSNQSGDMECMMTDLILGDIQAEISRIEDEAEKKRQQVLRQTKTPDYSWLMDWKLRSKKILGYRESSEIEFLCAKVKPNEWNRLIREWRAQVKYVESREEVMALFRKIVDEICASRYQRGISIQNVDELHFAMETEKKISAAARRPWTSQGSTDLPMGFPSKQKSQQQQYHQMAELSVFTLNNDSAEKYLDAHESV